MASQVLVAQNAQEFAIIDAQVNARDDAVALTHPPTDLFGSEDHTLQNFTEIGALIFALMCALLNVPTGVVAPDH